MMLLLISILFSSSLLFVSLLQLVFIRKKTAGKRAKELLENAKNEELAPKQIDFIVKMNKVNERLKNKLGKKQQPKKLVNIIKRSGLMIKPQEFVAFRIIATILAAMMFFLLAGNLIFLFLGAGLGYILPLWWVKKKGYTRIKLFNSYLPDMITTIISSLRAGFSFAQALKVIVEEAPSPIKEEMETVLKEMQYGSSLEEALDSLKERMPSEDLDLMIQAIIIQRQVGGNLATVLDKIVETIRDRTRIQQQIQTLTAQGKLSGIVIGLLPVALAFILYLIEPEYIGVLFTNPIGLVMVTVSVISGTVGFVILRKLTMIEV